MSDDDRELERLFAARREIDRALLEKHAREVAVLFTDIVGSTRFFERKGDIEGLALVKRHNDALFPVIADSSVACSADSRARRSDSAPPGAPAGIARYMSMYPFTSRPSSARSIGSRKPGPNSLPSAASRRVRAVGRKTFAEPPFSRMRLAQISRCRVSTAESRR